MIKNGYHTGLGLCGAAQIHPPYITFLQPHFL
nr:MAG TPA: hypothetical protein [Caudoviricetes sp.]